MDAWIPWTGPTRPAAPALAHGTYTYCTSNCNDPIVFPDPFDDSQLVMLFMALGVGGPFSATTTVGRATATVADPLTWTLRSTPVIDELPVNIRVGSAVIVGTRIHFYCTEYAHGGGENTIVSYISDDSGITFSNKSTVLTRGGQGRDDLGFVANPAVIKEGSTWTMIYQTATTADANSSFQTRYRYAQSSDGLAFTKAGGVLLSTGASGAFDFNDLEWHHISKDGDYYVLLYECAPGSDPWNSPPGETNFYAGVAYSTSLTSGWVKPDRAPFFAPSFVGVTGPGDDGDTFDSVHVGTPALYKIGPKWYLFYLAGQYADHRTFDIGIAPLDYSSPSAMWDVGRMAPKLRRRRLRANLR